VNLLGVSRVINIVNAQSIRGELTDENIVNLNRFWDSAQDIAMTCMTLAKRIGCVEPDEAYALGLFHNCGIPLMLSRFPYYIEVMEESYAQDQTRIVDVENQRMNTNHAVIGYYTAKSWLLPKHLCEAIASHHNAQQLFLTPDNVDAVQKNLLAILKMAEHICKAYRVLGNQQIDHEWNAVGGAILEYVGLSEYDFENLEAVCQELTTTS
jgi:HD-like signal output (HDOD) protein